MEYKKNNLPFELDSLEPHMSKETVNLHYNTHHEGYLNKLNIVFKNTEVIKEFPTVEELVTNLQKIEDPFLRTKARELGGGVVNHNFFWDCLKKDVELKDGDLKNAINDTWGSFEEFKNSFAKQSLELFGSGWVWLALEQKTNKLKIIKIFNQDNPWFLGFKPLLCIDLWEHSYYLDYNASRKDYIENFFSMINWDFVEEQFK